MTVRLKGPVIVISSYGMARCQCPINNSTLETLIRTKMWKISRFLTRKLFDSDHFSIYAILISKNAQVPFTQNPHV